jgi:acetoin:2,6-dichlorophenolindophenol oxidoreductase subunit alpha
VPTQLDSESALALLATDVVAPYGFERATVAGEDVPAIHAAFGSFLETARTGVGPFLLECLTHRRRGHYEGDAHEYRDHLAEDEWRRSDPVARFRQRAIDTGWLTPEAAVQLHEDARLAVEEAVEFGRRSPFPDPALTRKLVYAGDG